MLLILLACSTPSSDPAAHASSASPETEWDQWDLGSGIVVAVPESWRIIWNAEAEDCDGGVYWSGFNGGPEDGLIALSVPFKESPFGSFPTETTVCPVEREDGSTANYSLHGDIFVDGKKYFADPPTGTVTVTSLEGNTGARVALDGVSFRDAGGTAFVVTAAVDLDLTVSCVYDPAERAEGEDQDVGSDCESVSDTPPYHDATCEALAGDYPDDVKR